MLKGIETVVYYVDDLPAAARWYREALGSQPNHDSPYYVGFTVAGYELGLHPTGEGRTRGAGGQTAYWSVDDVDATVAHFVTHGASPRMPKTDVGGGIVLASVVDPFGNELGLIQNPHGPNR
jgi:predicted enzyme related to lactoylglutathione lyase